MYRKYSLSRTHVIDTYNYLLQAQENENGTHCMFHQVLISSQLLPSLIEQSHIEKVISESENQNSVNEVKGCFQYYLEQNLLQIRLRQQIKPISDLGKLPIRQVLKLVGVLNLDVLLSIKQMRSMLRHHQVALTNINRFFSPLILASSSAQPVLPFIDGHQIHFYDVSYQDAFVKSREKEQRVDERMMKRRISQKKIKKKSELASEDAVNADEVIFQKYMWLLVVLLTCKDIVEFIQDMTKLDHFSSNQIARRVEKLKASDKTEKMFNQLLLKCIDNESEYNLGIFTKECELLIDKYDKMDKINIEKPVQRDSKGRREQKLSTSKSCLALNKQLRAQISLSAHKDRPATRQSEKKLKSSKSMISLKFSKSGPFSFSKSRTLKNTSSLFSKSKQKLMDKTNLFQQSLAVFNKQNAKAMPASFSPGSSMSSMGKSATSNWFNQSMSENQSAIKLRNFKKTNNFTSTASHTPNHQPNHQQFSSQASSNISNMMQVDEAPENSIEKISESQLIRLSKLIKKQKQPVAIKEKQLDDKFTMTDQFQSPQAEIKEVKEVKEEKNVKPTFKREIVNTINFKFYEEFRKKTDLQKKAQIEKKTSTEKKPQIQRKELPKHKIVEEQQKKQQKLINKVPQKQVPNKVEVQKQKANIQDNSTIKESKAKRPAMSRKQSFDQQQFEQITFTKNQPPKITENTSTLLKKTNSIKQNNAQSSKTSPLIQQKQPQQQQPKQPQQQQPPQVKPKAQKITIIAIHEAQKLLYIKHFGFFLKFYKENSNKLNILPQLNNLTYVVNFLYYKTLLQNNYSQNSEVYKQLINLLCKKQQKISQQDKNVCLLYRVSFESLWQKAKTLKLIQASMGKGIEELSLKHIVLDSKELIQEFQTLTSQSNRLLQLIYKQLTSFVLANKIVLIHNNAFLIALQLIYLVTLTMIVSIQRENYYSLLLQGKYAKMQECFRFKYDKNEEEHFTNYKKKLENMDKVSLSVQEECRFFQAQYDKYR